MIVLRVRNVHEALPRAIKLLSEIGVRRDSRNGPVLMAPEPVATVYTHPTERVVFWPERDANPFFHLYESLWMLAGRNDLKPLARYTKQIAAYSDDGLTLHGAYGHRWRHFFSMPGGSDQLKKIVETLRKNKDDRRCVLQMWDAPSDLGFAGKDLPCNVEATVQIGTDGRLHLVVFCRSNDIVWGCYGANAVHFSMLLEYVAHWLGVPVGTYTQISVNWHAYLSTFDPLRPLSEKVVTRVYDDDTETTVTDPYRDAAVTPLTMPPPLRHDVLDGDIASILHVVDEAERDGIWRPDGVSGVWSGVIADLLFAHHQWKTLPPPNRFTVPLRFLEKHQDFDWVVAAREWLQRRYDVWTLANPNGITTMETK